MSDSKSLRDNTVIYLLIILAIATLLRVIFLGTIPNGFNCDEAVGGYEAYSVIETMRDRYGKFFPLFLKGLGNDYSESMYLFISLPFIKFLGLNEFATRLPAAFIGILTVLVVYYLAKECFTKQVGLIAALLLAINPWHIHFNRISYRANLLPFFICLGLLFFVKSFKDKKYLPLSGLLFGLGLWTYSSARVFISLFVLGLTIIFWQHLWRNKKETLIASLLFLLIFLPLFKFWISPEGMARAKGTGIETNPVTIIQYYLSYFSPKFLFFSGSSDVTMNPSGIGCLYYFELLTVVVGVWHLIKEQRKEKYILLLWLFLYPIPAALIGYESPLRSLVGAPLFAILSGYGATLIGDFFRLRRKILFLITTAFILTASLAIFSQKYFINYPLEAAKAWQYGMKEAITYAQKSSYNCIVMNSDNNSKSCFAIYDFIAFVPFYTQYPPAEYQHSPIPPWIRGSRDRVYSLGKYRLMAISKQRELNDKCLYILRPDEIPSVVAKGYDWKEVHVVKDSHGIEHWKLIEVTREETDNLNR